MLNRKYDGLKGEVQAALKKAIRRAKDNTEYANISLRIGLAHSVLSLALLIAFFNAAWTSPFSPSYFLFNTAIPGDHTITINK